MLLALISAAMLLTAQPANSQPVRQVVQLRELDRNGDGVITRAEWPGSARSFRARDWNNDGILSGDELRSDGTIDRRGAMDRSGEDSRAAIPRGTTGRQQNCNPSAPQIVDEIYQQVLERPADSASAPITHDLAAGRTRVSDIVAHLAKSREHSERFVWAPIVASLYRETLNRQPTQLELRDTAADLASGQLELIDVIGHMARRASNTDEGAVRLLYRRFLAREPDPEGLHGFTEQARRDGIESVARAIVASPEYRQRNGTTGQVDDTAAHEPAVRAFYRHLLGREPDRNAIYGLMQLASIYGIDAVVDRMMATPEYQQAYGSDGVPGRRARYCGPQP